MDFSIENIVYNIILELLLQLRHRVLSGKLKAQGRNGALCSYAVHGPKGLV